MGTTTDIADWLNFVEPENYEEIYCIYRSVNDVDKFGAFSCTKKPSPKKNMYFLKCDYCDDVLMLASEKAKEFFLKCLTDNYVNVKGDLDIEAWYTLNREMEKDD